MIPSDETIFEELKENQISSYRHYAKCDDIVCLKQMWKIKELPTTAEMYEYYNFCNPCKTLWGKSLLRCGHCNCKLRTRSRHRPNNSQGKTEKQLGIRRI